MDVSITKNLDETFILQWHAPGMQTPVSRELLEAWVARNNTLVKRIEELEAEKREQALAYISLFDEHQAALERQQELEAEVADLRKRIGYEHL